MLYFSLDPNNQKAREGLERIEKQGDMGMDTTYDVEDDINDSDNEVSVWHTPRFINITIVMCSS